MNGNNHVQQEPVMVYCLCIDLIGSTKRGLELTTAVIDRFNRALVDQIKPHLVGLALEETLIKFTGDGWLLMTDKAEKVPQLCCLATIMANRFQLEVSQSTEISVELVPPLRVAICAGRDIAVDLPNGDKDWVGDSARRATRASYYCKPNEVLIDYSVYTHILRDFLHHMVDMSSRTTESKPKKEEEQLFLYVLEGMKVEATEGLEVPDCFVYTLSIIGKQEAAKVVGEQIVKRLAAEATNIKADVSPEGKAIEKNVQSWNRLVTALPDFSSAHKTVVSMLEAGISPDIITYNALMDKVQEYSQAEGLVETMQEEGIQPDVVTYTTLINKAPDYETSKELFTKMQEEGIQPNVFTYTTLIKRAPDYEIAKELFAKMQEEGIQPNVFTYTTLIKRAPDYEIAKELFIKMQEEDVQPNVFTYTTLINKAPDFQTAKYLLAEMQNAGIQPSFVTYNLAFNKDLSGETAESLISWYQTQSYRPAAPMQRVITSFRKSLRIDEALTLARCYPHLEASQKLFRLHGEQAIEYFQNILRLEPTDQHAHYALGTTLMTVGRDAEARAHLTTALDLAKHETRKEDIRQKLAQIQS